MAGPTRGLGGWMCSCLVAVGLTLPLDTMPVRLRATTPVRPPDTVAGGPAAAFQLSPFAPRADVPFVPTPEATVVAMLNLAQVTSRDVVYDLGSGDGRIPIAAARLFGARGVGIEIDPVLVKRSRENLARAGVDGRVVFRQQDLFDADLREATVVTLFLFQGVNLKLAPKLKRELRPGSRVVSLNFTMGDAWPPDLSQDVDGLTIHLWTIP